MRQWSKMTCHKQPEEKWNEVQVQGFAKQQLTTSGHCAVPLFGNVVNLRLSSAIGASVQYFLSHFGYLRT